MAIRVSCAIILENGKLLLTRRSSKMRHPLLWEFPGGKIEPGETPEDCLRRELLEEISITVEIIDFLGIHSFPPEDPLLQLYCFMAVPGDGKIDLKEHCEYKFVKPEDALNMELVEPDYAIAELAIQWMSKNNPS